LHSEYPMIRFSCPTCRRVITVANEKAGAKGPCPGCGQRLEVPTPPTQTLMGELLPAEPPSLVHQLPANQTPAVDWSAITEDVPAPSVARKEAAERRRQEALIAGADALRLAGNMLGMAVGGALSKDAKGRNPLDRIATCMMCGTVYNPYHSMMSCPNCGNSCTKE
jgi:hypothetical protein